MDYIARRRLLRREFFFPRVDLACTSMIGFTGDVKTCMEEDPQLEARFQNPGPFPDGSPRPAFTVMGHKSNGALIDAGHAPPSARMNVVNPDFHESLRNLYFGESANKYMIEAPHLVFEKDDDGQIIEIRMTLGKHPNPDFGCITFQSRRIAN